MTIWMKKGFKKESYALLTTIFLLTGCASTPWLENVLPKKTGSIEATEVKPVSTTNSLSEEDRLKQQLEQAKISINELESKKSLLISTNSRLIFQLNKQKSMTAQIQLAFLSKQAEVNQLLLDNESTIQEMVRMQAKLRSRNSRAETVSTMAEATMLVNKAGTSATGDQNLVISRARQLLIMSSDALVEENYDGATFLADQSSVLVQTIINQNSQNQLEGSESHSNQKDTRFATPLLMTSTSDSNVREAPSIKSKVIFQLKKGESVNATGYFGEWIHMIKDGSQGWVYYKLISLKP